MRARRYTVLDVFAERPLVGNPLAVVHEAEGLDDATMQAYAAWTQLSETTFLLPPTDPQADYRVRIFTPGGELPFAGHPTLGSARAWLDAGGQPRHPGEVVQQCGVGLVRLRQQGDALAFEAPPCRITPIDAARLASVCAALGLPVEEVVAVAELDNGPHWLALEVKAIARVRDLRPDHAALVRLGTKVGVVARRVDDPDVAIEVRAFAAPVGIQEDPVTGSLQASLAGWLMDRQVVPSRYRAAQGMAVGRDGRVHVERLDDRLWIGGGVQVCVRGELRL